MTRILAFIVTTGLASGGILYPGSVDTSLFKVTTFASGLSFPTDITPLTGGPVLVSTSPNYGSSPGQLMYFGSSGAAGPSVYTSSYQGSPINGMLTGTAALGNNLAVGTFGIGYSQNTINILQPGATPSSPMTVLASLQMSYPGSSWDHSSIGMASRPTPGVPGSYDLILNVGSEFDNVATPSGDKVTLTGTGFSSNPSASLQGDSLYMVRINTNGAQPAVTAIQQVAVGIRNVYGMTFNAAGDLYFTDNAMDVLPAGSPQPVAPDGEPPQADEVNRILASQLGVGPPIDFGFPTCYVQYAYGGVPGTQVGSGCVMPLVAFQPITDALGVHELEGPTDLAFAPANFPAPYNNGIFVGFTGGESPNDEAGVAFYSFATNSYIDFIAPSNPLIADILGVASTNDALYISDFGTGNVYEIQSAAPEPASILLVGFMLLAGALNFRKHRNRHPV